MQMSGWAHHLCDFKSFPVAMKQFSRSVKSIFALTKQLPLFAVRNTSPFRNRDYDIGTEFRGFLAFRNDVASPVEPLKIVSFHDPDDVLSYNLDCWYGQSVVSNFDGAKEAVENKITRNRRAGAFLWASEEERRERRRLRELLFAECSSEGQIDGVDSDVLSEIVRKRK